MCIRGVVKDRIKNKKIQKEMYEKAPRAKVFAEIFYPKISK